MIFQLFTIFKLRYALSVLEFFTFHEKKVLTILLKLREEDKSALSISVHI